MRIVSGEREREPAEWVAECVWDHGVIALPPTTRKQSQDDTPHNTMATVDLFEQYVFWRKRKSVYEQTNAVDQSCYAAQKDRETDQLIKGDPSGSISEVPSGWFEDTNNVDRSVQMEHTQTKQRIPHTTYIKRLSALASEASRDDASS